MTNSTRGRYLMMLGSQFDLGDYVLFMGTWYKLTELLPISNVARDYSQARRFVGVDKQGGHRVILLYSAKQLKGFKPNS